MARLILTEASGAIREFELSRERITIGRHADNDIVLNDKAVSGRHTMVVTLAADSFIEDLNSTNGTLVNGRAVAKHPLADGDVISIGRNTLSYRAGASATAAPEPEGAGTASPPTARLRITSGPAAGRDLELVKPLTTLGKAGVQVIGVSRRDDDYVLVRVDGPGARLNGQELSADSEPLADGDVIEIGGTTLRFCRG